jgi:predicted branched-subunit amino acid permease
MYIAGPNKKIVSLTLILTVIFMVVVIASDGLEKLLSPDQLSTTAVLVVFLFIISYVISSTIFVLLSNVLKIIKALKNDNKS